MRTRWAALLASAFLFLDVAGIFPRIQARGLPSDDDDDNPNAAKPADLPTGMRITPAVAPGVRFSALNPDLPDAPPFTAGQAVTTADTPRFNRILWAGLMGDEVAFPRNPKPANLRRHRGSLPRPLCRPHAGSRLQRKRKGRGRREIKAAL